MSNSADLRTSLLRDCATPLSAYGHRREPQWQREIRSVYTRRSQWNPLHINCY
jgi:hypothetical protein